MIPNLSPGLNASPLPHFSSPSQTNIQVLNIVVFAATFGSNLYNVIGPHHGYGASSVFFNHSY